MPEVINKWGEIANVDRFRQPLIFDGLKYGTVQPTDIDAMLELFDKAYVFFEVKYGDKAVPVGQRLALERLVRDTGRVGKKSVAMVVSHGIINPMEPIRLADCVVREVFYSQGLKWVESVDNRTVQQVLSGFLVMLGTK